MKKAANNKKAAASEAKSPPALQDETAEQPTPARKAFPVVGIGASAGGLEPLEAFFASIPKDNAGDLGIAFVVIQHLSPNHKSIIGEILKKDTSLPIKEIQDGMEVEPSTVYFNPPNQEVGLYQGTFHLMEPAEIRHTRLPIDFFFRSLAQDLEEKAICVILSGTGSDGTLGLGAVKGGGGMTMAQAEEQAKYPFMPRSAIDTGLVDYVLPVERMPEEILRYVKHPYLGGREKRCPRTSSTRTSWPRSSCWSGPTPSTTSATTSRPPSAGASAAAWPFTRSRISPTISATSSKTPRKSRPCSKTW